MKQLAVVLVWFAISPSLGCNKDHETSIDEPQESTASSKGTRKKARRSPSKVSQCNKLIKEVNSVQEGITKYSGGSVQQLRALAALLDMAAVRVGAVEIEHAELTKLRDDYVTMVKDLSKASVALAKSIDEVDRSAMTRHQAEMSEAGNREAQIVDALNKLCSG